MGRLEGTAPPRKERAALTRYQIGPVITDVPFDDLQREARDLEVDRLAVFGLSLRNDKIDAIAIGNQMPVDVDRGQIGPAQRDNNLDRDRCRHLSKMSLELGCAPVLLDRFLDSVG